MRSADSVTSPVTSSVPDIIVFPLLESTLNWLFTSTSPFIQLPQDRCVALSCIDGEHSVPNAHVTTNHQGLRGFNITIDVQLLGG